MILRYITFSANHPDDSVMSGGKIVAPRGRSVMDTIRLAFHDDGYKVTDINQLRSVWFIDVTGAEGRFRLMIQYIEPWLLVIHDSKPFWKCFVVDKPDWKAFSAKTDTIMRSIRGVTDLQWTDGETLARR